MHLFEDSQLFEVGIIPDLDVFILISTYNLFTILRQTDIINTRIIFNLPNFFVLFYAP